MKDKKTELTLDDFTNFVKGIGTSKDARTHTGFSRGIRISQALANELYVTNAICQNVVNFPIEDAIQNWRTLLIDDSEEKKEVTDSMKLFDVRGKLEQGLKWMRVFGGAVIIPFIFGDNPSTPLDISKIRPGSLRNLVVLDRYRLTVDRVDPDPFSDNFEKPEFYTILTNSISTTSIRIHHSRVIRLDVRTSTFYESVTENYWGSSIFNTLWNSIAASQNTIQSIENLVYESNIDVFKFDGFNESIKRNSSEAATAKVNIVQEMKSVLNGFVIDMKDSYEKKSNNFSTLPEIYDRFMYNVAGASGIPITRLWGREPAGMSATGDGDEKIYKQLLVRIQENQMRPALDKLDPIILASTVGQGKDFEYIFNPIQPASQAEQLEASLKQSQIDDTYMNMGAIEVLDVQTQLAEAGTYVSMNASRIQKEVDESDNLFPKDDETEDE